MPAALSDDTARPAKREALIRTPAVDEAVAYLDAWLGRRHPERLLLLGEAGVGKSFLADWARGRARGGLGNRIFDDEPPPPDNAPWVWFTRPDDPRWSGGDSADALQVPIGVPEYERRRGVLQEWAAARGLSWESAALERLLALPVIHLQRLRSLADRAARESLLPAPRIRETDVLRSLARLGYLGG